MSNAEMAAWTLGIGVYVVGFVIVLALGIWARSESRSREEERQTARFTLMSPVWPVLLLVLTARKVWELLKDAAPERTAECRRG